MDKGAPVEPIPGTLPNMTEADSDSLRDSELRDPQALLDRLAKRYRLTRPAAYLAVVRDPATRQQLVSIEKLHTPALIDTWEPASDELRERLDTGRIPMAGPPPRSAPRHLPVLVVVRPGRCVIGPNERLWYLAERYANSLAWAWSTSLLLVTEHGWYDPRSRWGGTSPALGPVGKPNTPRHLRPV